MTGGRLLFKNGMCASNLVNFYGRPLFGVVMSGVFKVRIITCLRVTLGMEIRLADVFSGLAVPLLPCLSRLASGRSVTGLVGSLASGLFLLMLPIYNVLSIKYRRVIDL